MLGVCSDGGGDLFSPEKKAGALHELAQSDLIAAQVRLYTHTPVDPLVHLTHRLRARIRVSRSGETCVTSCSLRIINAE